MHIHKHEHCGCNHNLKHCRVCNVVYCTICGKEWGRNHYWNDYYWYTSAGNTWDNTFTTTGGTCCHT